MEGATGCDVTPIEFLSSCFLAAECFVVNEEFRCACIQQRTLHGNCLSSLIPCFERLLQGARLVSLILEITFMLNSLADQDQTLALESGLRYCVHVVSRSQTLTRGGRLVFMHTE